MPKGLACRWITKGIFLAVLGSTGPALAEGGSVAWPTFLRAGPGRSYTVIDEINRGKVFEVQSCDGGWCRIRYQRGLGFILQSAIASAAATVPASHLQMTDCFNAKRAGHGGGDIFRYCGG